MYMCACITCYVYVLELSEEFTKIQQITAANCKQLLMFSLMVCSFD